MEKMIIFVFLIAAASAQLQFQLGYGQTECAYIKTDCESDASCVAQEAAVIGCAAAMDVPYAQLVGVVNTTISGALSLCSRTVDPRLTDLYACDCYHTNGCSWASASAITESLENCVNDADCKNEWELVVNATTQAGVIWNEDMLGLQFPNDTNTNDQYCIILGVAGSMANSKLMNFGTALFAYGMDDGDAVLTYCNAVSLMGGSATQCAQDTDCATAWGEVVTTTEAAGVSWLNPNPALSGLRTPDTSATSTNTYDHYCIILASAVSKANSKLMAFGTSLFAFGGMNGVLEYCNVVTIIGNAAAECANCPLCSTTWDEIIADTEKEGVEWHPANPALSGLRIPIAAMRTDVATMLTGTYGFPPAGDIPVDQSDADYCEIFFVAFEKANVKAMTLGMALFAFGMDAGKGDAIVSACADIMEEDIMAEVGPVIMKVAAVTGGVSMLLTAISACVYIKFCKSKD